MPSTEKFLRLNEIIDHMVGVINEYQRGRTISNKTLDLMEQELKEAKIITHVLQKESADLKEVKEKINWCEAQIKNLTQKN